MRRQHAQNFSAFAGPGGREVYLLGIKEVERLYFLELENEHHQPTRTPMSERCYFSIHVTEDGAVLGGYTAKPAANA